MRDDKELDFSKSSLNHLTEKWGKIPEPGYFITFLAPDGPRLAFLQSASFWRFPKTDVSTALGHMCNIEEKSVRTLFGKNIPSTRCRFPYSKFQADTGCCPTGDGCKEKHIFPFLVPQTMEHDAQGLGNATIRVYRNALNDPRKETRSPNFRCHGDRVPKHHFLSRRSLPTTARASSPSDASQFGMQTDARSLAQDLARLHQIDSCFTRVGLHDPSRA